MKRFAVMLMSALIAHVAFAQEMLPQWIRDYPKGEYYVGFQYGKLKPKENVDERLKSLKSEALSEMVTSISAGVSGASTVEKTSVRTSQDGATRSASSLDYRQKIQLWAKANVANVQFEQHHDERTGNIYALAAVKKSDLARYCVKQVEFHLQQADDAVRQAGRFISSDERGGALKKVAEGNKNVDECAQYLQLLNAVDYGGGESARLLAGVTALRQEISEVSAKANVSKSFYISGTETIAGTDADIVVSRLKILIREKGYIVADSPADSIYTLLVEVKDCNVASVKNNIGGTFTSCYACGKVKVENVKTGFKDEVTLDDKQTKAVMKDVKQSCERAFEYAAKQLWEKMRGDKMFK